MGRGREVGKVDACRRGGGGRGRMLPEQFLLNTQGKKMLAAAKETNTAKCRNKCSNFLHTHMHKVAVKVQGGHTHTHIHTHTQSVCGCDGGGLVGRKRGKGMRKQRQM